MGPHHDRYRSFALAATLLVLLGACAPAAARAPVSAPAPAAGLPPVPRVEGPLDIRVAYPGNGAPRPRVDSTFIFGTVGTGSATLSINGTPVPVAPNGAFLAYLPVPASGVWELEARTGEQTDRDTVAYRVPPPPAPDSLARPAAPAPPAVTTFAQPLLGTVIGVRDTLATGSDIAPGYPVPSTAGARRWLLPAGTRLRVVARRGDLLQARLDSATTAWIEASLVQLGGPAPAPAPLGAPSLQRAERHVDVRIPAQGTPFLIGSEGRRLWVALYGVALPADTPRLMGDPLVAGAAWRADSLRTTHLELELTRPVWGYKAFYEPDGTLVLRLRRPPDIDARRPLRGVRIAVDAGHPPGGAIGPTGYTEAEANLAIALKLEQKLRAAGAEVLMIRSTLAPLVSATSTSAELGARVDMAVRGDADLLVSVHNNAFGEGVNPFLHHGTSVLYYHPHARDLAAALDRAIVEVTRVPDLGPIHQNIAIGRVTWMPSVITESLFMMFPEQENALRDPVIQDRLAEAHVRGIEAFLIGRAQ